MAKTGPPLSGSSRVPAREFRHRAKVCTGACGGLAAVFPLVLTKSQARQGRVGNDGGPSAVKWSFRRGNQGASVVFTRSIERAAR